MSKVRFQMFIEEEQKEALKRFQRDSGMAAAEIVRRALDSFIEEYKKGKGVPPQDAMTERLLSTGGVCKGGPKDLSDKHDKYLYGGK